MARPIEELVRPFQLGAAGQRIPVDPSLGTGRLSITSATIFIDANGDPQGGAGYQVDDTIVPSGGAGTTAILRVKDVDENGAILELTVDTGGSYTILPASPTVQRVSSGTGQGALIDLGANGATSTVKITYGGVGKLPSPVSEDIGIEVCKEGFEEVPNTRGTERVQIQDDTGSGAFITIARTTSLKMSKLTKRNPFNNGPHNLVPVHFGSLSPAVVPLMAIADGSKTDKCESAFRFHNPAPVPS